MSVGFAQVLHSGILPSNVFLFLCQVVHLRVVTGNDYRSVYHVRLQRRKYFQGVRMTLWRPNRLFFYDVPVSNGKRLSL